MPPKFPSRLDRAILFARGGASGHVAENTIESFKLALKLGATGLAADIWLTADEVPVVDSTGTVGSRLRRRPISTLEYESVPTPSVGEIYAECGSEFELCLDLRDPGALEPVLEVAQISGAETRLWLGHSDIDEVGSWRGRLGSGRLVHSTSLKVMKRGPERHAAQLRERGIDAVSLVHEDWSAGNVALFHRFGILTLGRHAIHERQIVNLLNCGIDGVISDHVDRMSESAASVE